MAAIEKEVSSSSLCGASHVKETSNQGLSEGRKEGYVPKKPVFRVEGIVYCDPCRVQFKTNLTEPLAEAYVRLQCHHTETGEVSIAVTAATNSTGYYDLLVEGDHENEICETTLIRSPNSDCSEIPDEIHTQEASTITLTNKNGISGNSREANPLFFFQKSVSPECAKELQEMGYIPELKDINQA